MSSRVKPMRSNDLVGKYSAEIKHSWQGATASIIKTGQLLIEAKVKLGPGWQTMFEGPSKLPFNQRTAQRLMCIARHPLISDPTHVSRLPPSWGTLYALARVPMDDLLAALVNGTVHPEMERKDAEALYQRVVQEGITWYPAVRQQLNQLIRLSKQETLREALALYLVEDDDEGGPPISPDAIGMLIGWLAGVRDTCTRVLEGERTGQGVRIERRK